MEFNSYSIVNGKNQEIGNYVKKLAKAISQGRFITLSDDGELIIFGHARSWWHRLSSRGIHRPPESSLEILKNLRFILLKAHDSYAVNRVLPEVNTIRRFCDEIIASQTIIDDSASKCPKDIIRFILARTRPIDAQRFRRVCKKWRDAIPRLKEAHKIVDWLISSDKNRSIENIDFTGVSGFENCCLNELTLHYPNLKSLIIPKSEISGDALLLLHRVPHLLELDITQTYVIDRDSLKYLEYTPELIYLKVSEWQSLKMDSLKNLKFTPRLRYLDIFYCWAFEDDTLKYLVHTPELEYLNVGGCIQLNRDSLKHLKYTPKLKYLILADSDHLDLNRIPYSLSSIEIYYQSIRKPKRKL